MQTIVRQSESHKDGRDAEVRGEIAHDRNRSATANEHRFLAKDIVERLRGDFDRRMVRVHHYGRARAENPNFSLNAERLVLPHKFLKSGDDLLRILFRDQANAYFRRGGRWNHRLGSRRGKSSGDAVNFECGTRPYA